MPTVRYVGGPTAVTEIGGLRLVTDPTFDPPGDHPIGSRVLTKTAGPAVNPQVLDRSAPCSSPTTSILRTGDRSNSSSRADVAPPWV
jgi:hypothetical protein